MNPATDILPPPATLAAPEHVRENKAANTSLLALTTLVAAVLRLHALTAKSFWLDEGISVQIARLPWPQFFYALRHREINMALYYFFLRSWLILGSTEGLIRGLSVLFSVATVPVLYALGARIFGRNVGLAAAWLLAINAYHIRYAQEARAYTLVVFFASLATLLLVRNLQEPSSPRWTAYTAACAMAVYSHLFGVLVILAHGVSLGFLHRRDLPWKDLFRSVRWLVYLLIPMALIVVNVGASSTRWIPATNMGAVRQFFVSLAGNDGIRLLALDAVAAALAIFAVWKDWRSRGRTKECWGRILVLAWLIVPVAAVLIVSVVRPIFLPRYMLPCLPAAVLIVAAGIAAVKPRMLAWIFTAAISIFSVLGVFSYYRQDFDLERDDWRAATSYVLNHALPGDGAFFYQNFGRLPFEFYRSLRNPSPRWPEALVAANGADWGYRDSLFAYMGESLQDAGSGGDRVWLILDLDRGPDGKPNMESTILRAVYGKGRRLADEKHISQITILLYARLPDGQARDDSASAIPLKNKIGNTTPSAD
jgi:mannosyltransferase